MRDDDRAAEYVEFVRVHRDGLVRAAVLLCAGDEAAAEDIVQITLTRIFLAWPRVRRARNPLAYARTSLTHVFVDESRRAHRRRETIVADPATNHDVGGGEARTGELRMVVLDALAALGPRQRAVVVLRHWYDLDVAQTARILGCSTGTVKSQNARALAHLRAALATADLQGQGAVP